MLPNQSLYQAFPVELRNAYREAVQARNWGERHSGLIDLTELALSYLASLCLSDYRTRSQAPVAKVEALLEGSRNRNLTVGRVLELFRASVEAMPDSLVPGPRDFPECRLEATSRFFEAVDAVKVAVEGLSPSASPAAIDVAVHVGRASHDGAAQRWWASWEGLVAYRNKVTHPARSRWPIRSDHYWEVMGPLLHDAIVELLTQAPAADAILAHPVANVTLICQTENGEFDHTICGESKGVWFEREVRAAEPVTERWGDQHWQATTAVSYVLDPAGDGWAIRSLFWDLRNGLPPAMDMRVGDSPAASARIDDEERPPSHLVGAREGRGLAPGTCGEFAQGVLSDGIPFHVTCPINKSATVMVEIRPARKLSVAGLHQHHRKLGLAIEHTVERLDLGPVAVMIRHWSDLDIGKGMGSSTADVLAGIRAVADAVGETLDPVAEGAIATKVESSDGSMYPGIAAVNHKTGELLKTWDWYPEFAIVMMVPQDSVDTHSISFAGQEQLVADYEVLLGRMDHAVAERSISAFAEEATRSAVLNERFLLNPYASNLTNRLEEFGALGIVVGHTGTVCGLLFPNDEAGRISASDACFEVRRQFPELKDVKVVTTPHCGDVSSERQ